MQLKIFTLLATLFLTPLLHADMALIEVGPDGRPVAVPIASSSPTVAAPPIWPQGNIYYTLKGGINFVTPWSAAIIAAGHDFIGDDTIYQGYLPLVTWWKITGVLGGGVGSDNRGSPLGGGILSLVNTALSPNATLNVAATVGYNFNGSPVNGKNAMAVLSASVQFLK